MIIRKETRSLGTIEFRIIDKSIAREIIVRNHYSKKWNSAFGVLNIGIFRESRLYGVIVYGNLMNTKSYRSISPDLKSYKDIFELNRMWISDELGRNIESMSIAASFRFIKKLYPNVKLVQSFADGRLGCGTIYKASNFRYYGYTKSVFFRHIKTGEVFHKAPLQNSRRPYGFLKKNRYLLDRELLPFCVKTYRYIYPLYKNVRISLKRKPYPKYEKGELPCKYTHSIGILGRLYWFYYMIEDFEYMNKTLIYTMENYGEGGVEYIRDKNKFKREIEFFTDYMKNKDREYLLGGY